ncbi:unnamed protein product [Cyclocybe aegerita]|uniref:Uncharacterized protein n=1 Tax=Cyclocybe aegerita TaxID=1973307 RepID=A0A8S0VUG3_CYCAE|nr:unnamed protein product [Cyclocybe aegerita]
MSAHEATKTNQKLFHRYAKVFSEEDPDAFALHADKLAAWLSDHKAYYPTARPEIIRLMIIAQMTLRKVLAAGNDLSVPFKASDYPSHPMVPPYINLVKAIEPYQSHFVEPNLLNFFKSIVATASQNHSPDIAGPGLLSTTSSTASNMTPIVRQAPVVTVNNGADPSPQAQMTTEANFVTVPASSSTMQESSPVPVRPPPRIVKPKAKKRKTIDFELLVEQDIQGLLQRKGGATPRVPDTKTIQEQLQPPTVAQPEVRIPEGSTVDTSNSDVVPHANPAEYKKGKSPNESHGAQPTSHDFQQMDVDENPVNGPIEAQEPNHVPDELVPMEVETSHEPKDDQEIPIHSASSIAQASPRETPSQMGVDKQKSELLDSLKETEELQPRTSMIQASRSDEHALSLNQTELSTGIYGPKLNIIATQQGHTQDTKISLQFDIPEDQFDLVSAWVKRKNDSQYFSSMILHSSWLPDFVK